MGTTSYRICVLCSGNICRSPMGEVILRAQLADAGLAGRVVVDSAGTGGWHEGDPADDRTLTALRGHGYDGSAHRAREFRRSWFADLDLVLVADRGHLERLRQWAPTEADAAKVRLIREFDEDAVAAGTLEVDDPYFGDAADFERCLVEVQRACAGVVEHLRCHARREPAVTDLRARPKTSTGLLISVASAVLFAVNGTVSKVALQSGLSSTGAGLGPQRRRRDRPAGDHRRAAARRAAGGVARAALPRRLRLTGIAMVQWLYFVAIQRMPVGIALLFEYTAPLMVALWVRFVQRQPVRSRLWLGLACALVGLALVAEFWRGMVLDPLGPGVGARRGGGAVGVLPDGRARAARARPDLADGLQLRLLRPAVGGRAAVVDVPVRPTRRGGRAARRPAGLDPARRARAVDRAARHGGAVPAGAAGRSTTSVPPGSGWSGCWSR